MNETEITKFRQIRWKSPISRKIEDFSKLISDENVFNQYFGENYINELTVKSKTIAQLVFRLGLIYSLLMVSLYVAQNLNNSEFEFFGYGFKNLSEYKELLLLLAAITSPISAVYSAYQNYLNALINECIKKLSPDVLIRKYYSLRFVDLYFEWLPNRPMEKHVYWHGFTLFLLTSFVVVLMLLFFSLLAGSFFIQINVIYDIAVNPSSSKYFNAFVLLVSISAILFSWLVIIIQLPMPEVDNNNLFKLEEIKKDDPEKYQVLMGKMVDESSKKEAISTMVSSLLIYIVTFTSVCIFCFPESLSNLTSFLSKAMPGVFIVLFPSKVITAFVRKKILSAFFKRYPSESPRRLVVFGYVTKIIILNRLITPFILSLIYSFYIFS